MNPEKESSERKGESTESASKQEKPKEPRSRKRPGIMIVKKRKTAERGEGTPEAIRVALEEVGRLAEEQEQRLEREAEMEEELTPFEDEVNRLENLIVKTKGTKRKDERKREKYRAELTEIRAQMDDLKISLQDTERGDVEVREEREETYQEQFDRVARGRFDELSGGWMKSNIEGIDALMLSAQPNGGATLTIEPSAKKRWGPKMANLSITKDGLLMGDTRDWKIAGGYDQSEKIMSDLLDNAEKYLFSENENVPDTWVEVDAGLLESDGLGPAPLNFEEKEHRGESVEPAYIQERIDNLHALRAREDAILGFRNKPSTKDEEKRRWKYAYHGVIFPGVIALENPYEDNAFYVIKIPQVDVESMPDDTDRLEKWVMEQEFMQLIVKSKSTLMEQYAATRKYHAGSWEKNIAAAIDTAVREQRESV